MEANGCCKSSESVITEHILWFNNSLATNAGIGIEICHTSIYVDRSYAPLRVILWKCEMARQYLLKKN